MHIQSPLSKVFYSACLGIIAFYMVVGPFALDPRNIAWLGDGYDPSSHYLGWEFFRQSQWMLPLGLNPDYGLGMSSSIVLADCIPLMALILKPMNLLLPQPFQYLGIWVLISLILQAYCAISILSLFTSDRYIQLLGGAFFVMAPPMLARIGVHTSLVSHFLILGSLYLLLSNTKRASYWWALLLSAAALIHFYLFAIVISLWTASLMRQVMDDEQKSLKQIYTEMAIIFILLALIVWQAGYFALGLSSSSTGHYGIGHWNIFSLFDASTWSYLLPIIPDVPGYEDRFAYAGRTYESFSYLGLGLIICLGFALWGLHYRQVSLKELILRYRYLAIVLGLLTLFAISNNIGIGPWNVAFPLPEVVRSLASILRASARMFWPVYYAFIILIFYIIIKSYSKRVAITILSFGLLIQIVDTSAGWLPLRHQLMQAKSAEWGTSLTDPFWAAAAKKYQKVVIVPEMNFSKGWRDIAAYAQKNDLATNAVYLGRVNQKKVLFDNEHYLGQIRTGSYDSDTLYLLNQELVLQALKNLPKNDALIRINNKYVLMPNYATCTFCNISLAKLTAGPNLISTKIGEPISFSADGFGALLLNSPNWSVPETWGTWAIGNEANLTVSLPQSNTTFLAISIRPFITSNHPTQEIEIVVNNQSRGRLVLREGNDSVTLPIGKLDQLAGRLNITFKFQNPISPKDVGLGGDERLLSIGLMQLVFK